MEFNLDGTISRRLVETLKRVFIKPKEGEQIKTALVKAKNQNKVKIGQIAVIDEREWLRLPLRDYNGAVWIEISKL